jgi:hypothetical protein
VNIQCSSEEGLRTHIEDSNNELHVHIIPASKALIGGV